MAITLLSQRDPEWKNNKIGQSNVTIGDYGCTITAISMASEYFGHFRKPSWMAKNLKFTKDGRILWHSIGQVLPFKFDYRYYACYSKVIDAALRNPNQVVLLEIRKAHWVLALRKSFLSNNYIAADPWLGQKKTYSPSMISGCAVLELK